MTKEYPSTQSEKRVLSPAIKQGFWSLSLRASFGFEAVSQCSRAEFVICLTALF